MGNLQSVNAGDLIRADYINSLVAAIQDLQTRVANLEQGRNEVVITGITDNAGPSSTGAMAIGDTITITGQNFASPSTANHVSFGGVTLAALSGNNFSTTIIACDIPTVTLGPNNTAVSVPVIVSNANGTSLPWNITVGPQIQQQSGVVSAVQYTGTTGTQTSFSANATVQLTFQATIVTTLVRPATYTATPNIVGAGWQVALVGSASLPIQPAQQVGQSTTQTWLFTVNVTAPPTNASPNAATATLSVTVASSDPQSSNSSPTLNLAFNAQANPPDNRVTLVPITPQPFSLKAGAQGFIVFQLTIPNTQGTFTLNFTSTDSGFTLPPQQTVNAPANGFAESVISAWTPPLSWSPTASSQIAVEIKSTNVTNAFDQTWPFPVTKSP